MSLTVNSTCHIEKVQIMQSQRFNFMNFLLYWLQHFGFSSTGSGKVGMISPGASEEKVLRLKRGDLIPVQLGSTSWWFNDGNTNFDVVFLGDTSKAYSPGNITYFLLAGPMGMPNGFSNGFNKFALGLSE